MCLSNVSMIVSIKLSLIYNGYKEVGGWLAARDESLVVVTALATVVSLFMRSRLDTRIRFHVDYTIRN